MIVFLPIDINYVVFNKNLNKNNNYIFMYNKYCSQLLIINHIVINRFSITLIGNWCVKTNNIINFFLKFNSLPNKKLKFSGKGYKIIKKGVILNLYLNTSHNQWAFFFKTIVIKTQKQRFLFINKNIFYLNNIIKKILNIR